MCTGYIPHVHMGSVHNSTDAQCTQYTCAVYIVHTHYTGAETEYTGAVYTVQMCSVHSAQVQCTCAHVQCT